MKHHSFSKLARGILDETDRAGVLLVHDRALPCVTAFVVGEPVAGSWWSHPLANGIYNALQEIDDEVATVKLIAGKQTLVAARLWPELLAVCGARREWQTGSLSTTADALLHQIESSADPVLCDKATRDDARRLEQRLLVYGTDVHTPSGHHVKALQSWTAWAAERAVTPTANAQAAMHEFEALVPSAGKRRLLPWPAP